MRGYQDASFTVAEVRGATLRSLVGFGREGRPEKLLLEVEGGARYEAYLDAWLGFWHELDDRGHRAVLKDYEEEPVVDYGARHGLAGLTIQGASCSRTADEGTCLEIQFSTGTLRLCEANPGSPHSESIVEFVQHREP